MKKIIVTTIITSALFFGQITGQTTTTTTSQSQNGKGKIETYTQTETQQPNGRTITTTTYTSTESMAASFGFKVSAAMSDFIIRNTDDYQSNMKFGTSGGIFLKLESQYFALQYELALRFRSFEMENTVLKTKTDYQYWGLELPIYFMGLIPTSSGQIFIGAGPYVSVGLDFKQEQGNIDLLKKDNVSDKSVMNRWDFGLNAMAGYEFKIGLSLFANYQVGLINMLQAEKDNMTMKNQTVGFGIGYKF